MTDLWTGVYAKRKAGVIISRRADTAQGGQMHIMIGFLGWILVLVVLQQLKVPIWIWIVFVIGTLFALLFMLAH